MNQPCQTFYLLSLLLIIINLSYFLPHLAHDTSQAEKQMYELIDVICRTEACHAWNILSHSFAQLDSQCKTDVAGKQRMTWLPNYLFLPPLTFCNSQIMLASFAKFDFLWALMYLFMNLGMKFYSAFTCIYFLEHTHKHREGGGALLCWIFSPSINATFAMSTTSAGVKCWAWERLERVDRCFGCFWKDRAWNLGLDTPKKTDRDRCKRDEKGAGKTGLQGRKAFAE